MANKMPREIAPGVFWIGDCLAQRHKGKIYHGYNAAFLVARDKASIFDQKVAEIAQRYEGKLSFRYTGPWPPYNFVTIRLQLERSAVV